MTLTFIKRITEFGKMINLPHCSELLSYKKDPGSSINIRSN